MAGLAVARVQPDRARASLCRQAHAQQAGQMGVKTRLRDYDLGAKDIDAVLAVLEKHRMVKLGEHRDVTLEVSRKVLEASL